MQTQMHTSKLGSGFSGAKLGVKPSLAGSSLRFKAQFRAAGVRRSAMNIRAEKVGGDRPHAFSRMGHTASEALDSQYMSIYFTGCGY